MRSTFIGVLLLMALAPGAAQGTVTTDLTGNAEPFANEQPSLALNYLVRTEGAEDELGEVGLFAGNFAPRGWALAAGQELPIAGNEDLFGLLGTTFGGDGSRSFGLPDLRGRTPIGAGEGFFDIGDTIGEEQVTLPSLPPHDHPFARPGLSTEVAGVGRPHSNYQPSLALTPIIATQGIFPSRNSVAALQTGGTANLGASGSDPFIGEVAWIAHDRVPEGWARADGSLLQISFPENQALFSIVGTIYGGNGRTTFGLPDLRGRAAIGEGQGPGLTDRRIGIAPGAADETITLAQTPDHTHTVPNTAGGSTVATPGAPPSPQSNVQPSLALTHLIATQGEFPTRNLQAADSADGDSADGDIARIGSATRPILAGLTLFAGNFEIRGFDALDGRLQQISGNPALFSLLGTIYGGDGRVDFALPDLRGRASVGAGDAPGLTNRVLGLPFGAEESTLTVANLPPHVHRLDFLPGDFNNDGTVDAADYTVWRDNLGQPSISLPNSVHDGAVGSAEYETWRAFYGQTLDSAEAATVPEPTLGWALIALPFAAWLRRSSR